MGRFDRCARQMGPWPCRPVRGIGAGRRHLAGPARLDDLISRKNRSEEHTSELQSLMRISYAVFCLKKKKQKYIQQNLHLNIKQHYTTHEHSVECRNANNI